METANALHSEPIYRYHDFYVRLYSGAAIATFVAAGLSLLWFSWPICALLVTGGSLKALFWLKHRRARRKFAEGFQLSDW